ncbi:hypothetical protein BU23DRAFT_625866 [Bimuria novae-zelandiae CBS 107.79]|uniref:Uncharacterized protein n=1 Tax=Bimuria novae-zelandiae CBS 107.79 TaxID=1447943 RepID=A0A6A5VXE7_9PLEO|nr:hypothetical protein BU23DRAFT_625866 [Bimuria novae-zelandiae CBS 107.79]
MDGDLAFSGARHWCIPLPMAALFMDVVMMKTLVGLHVLNALIGSLCIVILGLATHSILVKDKVDQLLPNNVKSTGLGMLMWAGCGGVVDMILFLCLMSPKSLRHKAICIHPCAYYTYAEHSSHLSPENWGCDIGAGSNAHSLCREMRAAGYLLIPVLVMAVGLLATVLSWIGFGQKPSRTDARIPEEAQPNQQMVP